MGAPPLLPPNRGSLVRGIMIGVVINLGALVMGILSMAIIVGVIVVAGYGVVQYAWILPLYLHFRRQGEVETAKGLLVASGISFLLSAACWGLIFSPKTWH